MNLSKLVNEYVTEQRVSESGCLYCSSLGDCTRAEIVRWRHDKAVSAGNKPEQVRTHPMSDKLSWTLNRYGWYEVPFVQALRRKGLLMEPPDGDQFRFEKGMWVGKPDALYKEDGQLHYLEVKSVSPGGLKYRREEGPQFGHQLQVWATISLMDVQPNSATIAYITRWYHGKKPVILPFDVTPSSKDIAITTEAMQRFENAAKAEGLPPIPYGDPEEHPYLCTRTEYRPERKEVSCPWFGHCWPDYLTPSGDYQRSVDYMPF